MKKQSFSIHEFFYCLAFLLWLVGSSLTHIRNGVELSLWLMGFAVLIAFAATVFPWLGMRWLRLEKKGCLFGQRFAIGLQVISWGVFAWAMFLRLTRSLPGFHILIGAVTLIWAIWLLVFIYSRHACAPKTNGDKLEEETRPFTPIINTREDI
jgi:hypothetical protein